MIDTLRAIESRGMFDRCRVFKRGYSFNRPELVHISGDGKYQSVAEAVIVERNKNRQELLREPQKFYERVENLRRRILKNGIDEQIERLNELKTLFDLEVEKKENVKE